MKLTPPMIDGLILYHRNSNRRQSIRFLKDTWGSVYQTKEEFEHDENDLCDILLSSWGQKYLNKDDYPNQPKNLIRLMQVPEEEPNYQALRAEVLKFSRNNKTDEQRVKQDLDSTIRGEAKYTLKHIKTKLFNNNPKAKGNNKKNQTCWQQQMYDYFWDNKNLLLSKKFTEPVQSIDARFCLEEKLLKLTADDIPLKIVPKVVPKDVRHEGFDSIRQQLNKFMQEGEVAVNCNRKFLKKLSKNTIEIVTSVAHYDFAKDILMSLEPYVFAGYGSDDDEDDDGDERVSCSSTESLMSEAEGIPLPSDFSIRLPTFVGL